MSIPVIGLVRLSRGLERRGDRIICGMDFVLYPGYGFVNDLLLPITFEFRLGDEDVRKTLAPGERIVNHSDTLMVWP